VEGLVRMFVWCGRRRKSGVYVCELGKGSGGRRGEGWRKGCTAHHMEELHGGEAVLDALGRDSRCEVQHFLIGLMLHAHLADHTIIRIEAPTPNRKMLLVPRAQRTCTDRVSDTKMHALTLRFAHSPHRSRGRSTGPPLNWTICPHKTHKVLSRAYWCIGYWVCVCVCVCV
jgi:hypothetical protein